ncbi:MAG: hypothetical protein EP297_00315 [Gammaproteobacteria bacterium]|nr:MAG: hypothetical protein EP297_00315 [Gammaproteobacteria bacterium]
MAIDIGESIQADTLTAKELTRNYPNAFVFSFTRNPFSRISSCYFDKIVKRPELPVFFRKHGFYNRMDFSEFVEKIVVFSDDAIDIHLSSQTRILSHKGHMLPKFIGRVENIDKDWQCLLELVRDQYGIQFPRMRQLNRYSHDRPTTRELFSDPHLIELVRERYAADFENFYPGGDLP